MPDQSLEQELGAIQTVVSALAPLNKDAQQRVLDYAVQHLGLANPTERAVETKSKRPTQQSITEDIVSLKESRKPKYATQMAAIVAYYLSEIAPIEERKTTIGVDDIRAYFKKAKFRLPQSLPNVLVHATQGGYFDSLGNGQYKLNPVGYNLVVHGLPEKTKTAPQE